jgi:uncharacterized protein YjbI with pentapeptide repeats
VGNKEMKFTTDELQKILELHKKFISGEEGGESADLRNANLEGAYLEGTHLEGAYLYDADLRNANLEGAYLYDADLRNANLEGAYLTGARLRDAQLEGAHLTGAYLGHADLAGTNLENADLRNAYLYFANLTGANLRKALLMGTHLEGAYLYDADLRNANLEGAYLYDADLRNANLEGAYLEGAHLGKEKAKELNRLREQVREARPERDPGERDHLTDAGLREALLMGANLRGVGQKQQEAFTKKFRISIAHTKLLSKGYSSLFVVQIYFPEMREKVLRTLKRDFNKHEIVEYIEDSELEKGPVVRLKLFCSGITFSDFVDKKLDNNINSTKFTAKPDDNCRPGIHQVTLAISDAKTKDEYQKISFKVKVTDFAFDHVSRPFLSKTLSFAIGAGSLTVFILTLLGQIDTTLGLASGTVASMIASGIYARFLSSYQQPKIANTP